MIPGADSKDQAACVIKLQYDSGHESDVTVISLP